MKFLFGSFIASIERQSKAFEGLAGLGLESAERFTELQAKASLAAIDNALHHAQTVAHSGDVADAMDLHISSVVPAMESAKSYAAQVLSWSEANMRSLGKVLSSTLASD